MNILYQLMPSVRSKNRLIEMIRGQCIEHGEFTLKSGKTSSYYIDLRQGTLNGPILHEIVEQLKFTIEDWKFDAIGGPCVGADPIVGAFLYMYGDRGFLIRKQEKEHGKDGRIIGSVLEGDYCVLVEDVVTSGGSVLEAAKEIQKFGCKIVGIVAIVDRLQGASELFDENEIPYKSVLTIKDIEEV